MKNIKVIKTAKIENKSWKRQLSIFLRNYRVTPHESTKSAPASLLLRNADTTRLPKYKTHFIPTKID